MSAFHLRTAISYASRLNDINGSSILGKQTHVKDKNACSMQASGRGAALPGSVLIDIYAIFTHNPLSTRSLFGIIGTCRGKEGVLAKSMAVRGVNNMLFLPREEGQGLVEYALILVLVAIVVIAILLLLGPIIGNVFSNIVGAI
jgi:pilus assembly protein Flp/PilA